LRLGRLTLVGIAALALGCAASGGVEPANPPTPAPGPPPPKSEPNLADRAWGVVSSTRFGVDVALPERKSWQIEELKEPWWIARHAPSSSELRVRTWRTSRLSKREDCAEQVALWRPGAPDPKKNPESVVERRALTSPSGYQTELVVGVRRASAAEIEGYALAIGHTIGECYAAILTTRASGGRAEASVGERLALFADAVFPRIERIGIEDRVR